MRLARSSAGAAGCWARAMSVQSAAAKSMDASFSRITDLPRLVCRVNANNRGRSSASASFGVGAASTRLAADFKRGAEGVLAIGHAVGAGAAGEGEHERPAVEAAAIGLAAGAEGPLRLDDVAELPLGR